MFLESPQQLLIEFNFLLSHSLSVNCSTLSLWFHCATSVKTNPCKYEVKTWFHSCFSVKWIIHILHFDRDGGFGIEGVTFLNIICRHFVLLHLYIEYFGEFRELKGSLYTCD